MSEVRTPPSIVVGIDGSKAAIRAALWAIDEAVSRDIPLRLLYAIEPDDVRKPRRTGPPEDFTIAENAIRYAFTAVELVGQAGQDRSGDHSGAGDHLIDPSFGVGGHGVCRRDRRCTTSGQPGWGSTTAALVGSGLCPVAIIRDQGHREALRAGSSSTSTGLPKTAHWVGIAIEEARLRNAPLKVISQPANWRR